MEGKPHIPTTLWTYSDMASGICHITSPVFSDTPELTFSDPILQQVTQPIPQSTGGAVRGATGWATGGVIPKPSNPLYHH